MPTKPATATEVKPQTTAPLTRQEMIELGSLVTDAASGTKGMVTLLAIDLDGSRNYCFQPTGLDKETKQPLQAYWLVGARFKGGKRVLEPDLPFELLGTEAEDMATPFKGTAVTLTIFMSGCLHVTLQPKGKIENGGMIKAHDFDIRRLKGPAIKKMTEAEKAKDMQEKPSPMEYDRPQRAIPQMP